MDMPCLLLVALPFWAIIYIFLPSNAVLGAPLFPAMFVFGDSLVDNGNNNYLNSLAKANYVPYGIDFPGGATGRFSNGKILADFLAEMIGLPYLPAFTDTLRDSKNVLRGVNYASAAAGIIDETGRNLGDRFSFNQQLQNFETTLSQLKNQMDKKNLSQLLAKSLTIVTHGSNDYLNNYLMPELYTTSSIYDPEGYAELLISLYKKNILALHDLGLRKFLLAGVGPLGCIPYQRARNFASLGQCVYYVNQIVEMFNAALKSLVGQLNADNDEAIFAYGNTYGIFVDFINNPSHYGFTVTDRGCCGIGWNRGLITCLPLSIPCSSRDEYVFWDAYHPTQAATAFLAGRAFAGPPSDCYPINVKQMAQK